tara:strand:+ start:211 stop:768 length:558 start_codon:yes stop_codon:yes gene_type:complete
MMRLLLILILSFSLQSFTKADDIRDFEIEGMSVGDSFSKYFNVNDVKLSFPYNNKSYGIYVPNRSFKNYSNVQFHFKKGDKTYKIHALDGHINFYEDIENCYIKKKEIVREVIKLFPDAEIQNRKSNHYLDKTGESKVDATIFWISTGETIRIECYDWSNKFNYGDKLIVGILDKEITKFFMEEN